MSTRNLAERVERLRAALGVSSAELAARIGVSRETVYTWIRDPDKAPHGSTWKLFEQLEQATVLVSPPLVIAGARYPSGVQHYLEIFDASWREEIHDLEVELLLFRSMKQGAKERKVWFDEAATASS